jgi:hypothetical protein
VPSSTALATSVASARVGRGFLIIDSSIWVAVITGLPGGGLGGGEGRVFWGWVRWGGGRDHGLAWGVGVVRRLRVKGCLIREGRR